MASNTLNSLKVAILVTDGFEQVEMVEPRKALDEAGADTSIVSPKTNQVRSWNFTDWGAEFPVDHTLDKVSPQDFDALLLPGGGDVEPARYGAAIPTCYRIAATLNSYLIGFILGQGGVSGVMAAIAGAEILAMVIVGRFGPRTTGLALDQVAAA